MVPGRASSTAPLADCNPQPATRPASSTDSIVSVRLRREIFMPSEPLRRGDISATRASQSMNRASAATSTAPTTSVTVCCSLMPVVISWPRPPAPVNDASAAVPTMRTSAVRTPATITGSASGSSMRTKVDHADMPMPRDASTNRGSTPSSPVTVLRDDGQGAVHGQRDDGADTVRYRTAPHRARSTRSPARPARSRPR